MTVIPDRVQLVLDAHNLQVMIFEPGSTPTSEMAAEKIGCAVGQIAKSMLFKGKDGEFRLLLCPGHLRVDNKKLKNLLGVKARMATADETLSVTGFQPGGVCPFAVEGIQIYIDRDLRNYQTVYPAAGTSASGVPVGFEQLKQITGAIECVVMG